MLWRECALVGTMLHRTLDSDSHSDSRTPTCGALTAVLGKSAVRSCVRLYARGACPKAKLSSRGAVHAPKKRRSHGYAQLSTRGPCPPLQMDGKSQQTHVRPGRPGDMPPQAIEQFIAETSGMTPGYAGFRPEAGDAPDLSKFGGVVQRPAFHDPWAPKMEPNDPFKRHFEWRREKDIADAPPSYRESVGGVKSGYTGYVPRGLFKIGTTHMGGSSPWESPGVPYAHTGHEGYKISAPGQPVGMAGESEVTVRRIPKCTVSCISHRYPGCPRQSPFLLP